MCLIVIKNMRTTVTQDGAILTIENDTIDNHNFVVLSIVNDRGEDASMDISLTDLLPAIIGFDAQRSRTISEELDQKSV